MMFATVAISRAPVVLLTDPMPPVVVDLVPDDLELVGVVVRVEPGRRESDTKGISSSRLIEIAVSLNNRTPNSNT